MKYTLVVFGTYLTWSLNEYKILYIFDLFRNCQLFSYLMKSEKMETEQGLSFKQDILEMMLVYCSDHV